MLVVQRVLSAKRTNLHEKYDYPGQQTTHTGPTACSKAERLRSRILRGGVYGPVVVASSGRPGAVLCDELENRVAFGSTGIAEVHPA